MGGFIPGLYDTLEQQLCIDLTREYASGESNGGMQTYQLGVDLAKRLAAITPEVCACVPVHVNVCMRVQALAWRRGVDEPPTPPCFTQNGMRARPPPVVPPCHVSPPSSAVWIVPPRFRDGAFGRRARARPARPEGHDRPRQRVALGRRLVLHDHRGDL